MEEEEAAIGESREKVNRRVSSYWVEREREKDLYNKGILVTLHFSVYFQMAVYENYNFSILKLQF